MRSIAKFCAVTAVCAVAGLASTVQSRAGVMSIARGEAINGSSLVENVHWRGHWGWRHAHWRGHHWGWRHAHWRHHHWRYAYWPRHYWYRHAYWRHHRYGYYGYYPWFNPAGALAGAAVGLATAPLWAFGGYPYYGYPYYY